MSIFRPRQAVQRVTVNANNRRFIAGGVGPGRVLNVPPPAPLRGDAPAPQGQGSGSDV